MKKYVLFVSFLSVILYLTACQISASDVDADSDSSASFTEDSMDYVWNSSDVVNVQLNTTSATSDGVGVSISGTAITISKAGTYKFTGTLTGGQILVNSEDAGVVRLLLNGVTISNSSSAPIFVKKAAKAVANLVDGTVNTLTDASKYVYGGSDTEPNAAVFSNTNLVIFGAGSLTVKGNYADGISSDDGLLIKSGTISVTAVDDAIRGKDYLVIEDGTIAAAASTGHGLKSDNEDSGTGYVLVAGGTITSTSTSADAIHGKNNVYIKGGTMTLTATSSQGLKGGTTVEISGGKINVLNSHEGIESAKIVVSGGVTILNALNDAINATCGTVNGGSESNDGSYFYMKGGVLVANGSDAVDSNGNIEVSGGYLIANGPQTGVEEGIDCNGTFNINGGLVISSGSSSQMTKAMSTSSSQPGMFIKSSSALSSSSLLHIENAVGTDVITVKLKNGGYYFHASSGLMTKGASYKIYFGGLYSGGSFIGETTGYGLYTGGTYSTSGATLKSTPTLSTSNTVNTISL